jgi:hypothetical protein
LELFAYQHNLLPLPEIAVAPSRNHGLKLIPGALS